MAIERLHFEEGVILPDNDKRARAAAAHIINANLDDFEVLEVGSHDLTPLPWERHGLARGHEVVVLENGEGIYVQRHLTIPTIPFVLNQTSTRRSHVPVSRSPQYKLNRPNRNAFITGSHPEQEGLYLFDAVRFVPDEL